MTETARAHRSSEHADGLVVEAWGPDRAACLEEVVHGLVAAFVDLAGDLVPIEEHQYRFDAEVDDTELLAVVLGEVVYLFDARERVPLTVNVQEDDVAVRVRFGAVDAVPRADAAVPKAINPHGLEVGPDATGRWRVRATIDV